MKLHVNISAVKHSSRGVQRYTSNVLSHLKWREGIELITNNNSAKLGRLGEVFVRSDKNAILWTPCQRGSILSSNHVVTVHDFINIEYVHRHDIRLKLYKQYMETLLNRARAVVAISYSTRDAILRNFSLPSDSITVIQSGIDPVTCLLENYSAGEILPFVLLITNDMPHKNTIATCRAWARSIGPNQGVLLKVIGKLPREALHVCRNIPLEVSNWVDDSNLISTYRNCLFLIAPSLSEGHDLPVAEALSQGADVLCSDIPVHREFYEGQVQFFEPTKEDSIVEAINAALISPKPWFTNKTVSSRTFADVSRDYERLFSSLE